MLDPVKCPIASIDDVVQCLQFQLEKEKAAGKHT